MSGDHLMAGAWPTTDGNFGAQDGGPVVIFPKSKTELWTVVVSEASRFMAGGIGPCSGPGKNQSLCGGLRGTYDTVPKGFSFETIMSVSSSRGVANGMFDWGSKLLAKYGKQRTMPYAAKSDYISKLGYSSTGWFHYCPNPDPDGKYDADRGNYEVVVVVVVTTGDQ